MPFEYSPAFIAPFISTYFDKQKIDKGLSTNLTGVYYVNKNGNV